MKKLRELLTLCFLIINSCCARGYIGTESITNNPCSPPCWQGITPGVTTMSEAVEILNTLNITNTNISPESVTSFEIFDKTTGWQFLDFGRVYFNEINDVIQCIVINPLKDLKVDQLVSLYGPPSHILIFKGFGDYTFIKTFMIYKSSGLLIDILLVPYDHNNKPKIGQSDVIDAVYFCNPQIFGGYLNYLFNRNPQQAQQEFDVFSQPWHGFGEYEYSR
jgi:hypothetical protein